MRYDRAPCPRRAMFSTLLGALPVDQAPPVAVGDEADSRLDNVAALSTTGLELISDGGEPAEPTDDPSAVVARWQAAGAATAIPTKAVVMGPWSSARSTGRDALEIADRLRATIAALASAGCPLVEISEQGAAELAGDPSEAAAFSTAHRRLLDGTEGIHASLALGAGSLDGTPPGLLFDLAYASYAFDLIGGPDNWRLIVQAPADRGIIVGALDLAPGADDTREVLVWAAHYAASTNGRSLARVGLANAPTSPGGPRPTRAEMLRKLAVIAEAGRIAAVESAEELVGLLDRRAVDPRAGRSGRFQPGPLEPGRFAPARRRGRTGR
jgi:hypothetical protein